MHGTVAYTVNIPQRARRDNRVRTGQRSRQIDAPTIVERWRFFPRRAWLTAAAHAGASMSRSNRAKRSPWRSISDAVSRIALVSKRRRIPALAPLLAAGQVGENLVHGRRRQRRRVPDRRCRQPARIMRRNRGEGRRLDVHHIRYPRGVGLAAGRAAAVRLAVRRESPFRRELWPSGPRARWRSSTT